MVSYFALLDWKNYFVKMAILPKEINRFKATPIKTTTHDIYQRTTTNNLKCIQNQKRPQIAKAILRKKNKAEGIMLPDFKSYKAVCSVAQSCLTLCNPIDYSPPVSSIHGIFFLRKNTRVGCYFLLQGIFLTQGWNTPPPYPCLLNLLYWQTDSLPLAPPGKPLLLLRRFSRVRLCDPIDSSPPGPPSLGFSRQ